MRKIAKILCMVFILIVCLFIFELIVPSAKGFTIGILSIFGTLFKEFFLQDTITEIATFLLIAAILGTLCFSKKEENRIWEIASIVAGVVSIITLCAH